ncbi:hypothetical protein HYALB_00008709 [Hymenoscyphus albidus]|uniref:Uncharacterized protein n=1 Tax=Hymenoscyphus albidus TaxID=595503 RepID=A0A9N9LNI9_9HELO|nr:hypothetical protein HYALB_00008709 [Hymenoscyphus albidus]
MQISRKDADYSDGELRFNWLINHPQEQVSNEERPAFKLTILDSRTQKSYEIPVVNNAVQAIHFQKISPPDYQQKLLQRYGSGIPVLDPSFKNTAVVESKITHVDGTRGKIQYRQYPIEQLYQQNDYEEVIHLLIWGRLPSFDEKHMLQRAFEEQARPHKSVIDAIGTFPRETPSFLMIIAGLSAWAATRPSTVPVFAGKILYHNDPEALDEAIIGTIAVFTTVVALVYCHQNDLEFTPPDPQLSIVENMPLMPRFCM